jgi:hypothetical protein
VLGGHFRQDEAGQGLVDFQREQAHGGRFARPGAVAKLGIGSEILIKRSCPRPRVGECCRRSEPHGSQG